MLFIFRVKDCIKAGKAEEIDVTIDSGKWYEVKLKKQTQAIPEQTMPFGGNTIQNSKWHTFPTNSIPSMFNYGYIYHYIIESMPSLPNSEAVDKDDLADAIDCQSSTTAKPLTRGQQYVDSKYVADVMDTEDNGFYYLKANVHASMISQRYSVQVQLSKSSGAVTDARCECKASALRRCSHIAALLLYLSEHVQKHGYEPNLSSTQKLCCWNTGKKVKNPNKVHEASYPSLKKPRLQTINHDPRPPPQRNVSQDQINGFVSNLQQSGSTGMWETILSIKYTDYDLAPERKEVLRHLSHLLHSNLQEFVGGKTEPFVVQNTEVQSSSDVWHSIRRLRLTASTAREAMLLGKNLLNQMNQGGGQQGLLRFLRKKLWGLDRVETVSMQLGINKEDEAREDYKNTMTEKRPLVTVETSGLWINPSWPLFACSPDGLVYDPSESSPHGLLEIKVLKVLQKHSVEDLPIAVAQQRVKRSVINQACFKIGEDKTLQLRKSHAYYSQVQHQLAITDRKWCDFVLWSSKGKPNIERIYRDEELILELLTNQTWLWKCAVAPELFEMRALRNLMPFVMS